MSMRRCGGQWKSFEGRSSRNWDLNRRMSFAGAAMVFVPFRLEAKLPQSVPSMKMHTVPVAKPSIIEPVNQRYEKTMRDINHSSFSRVRVKAMALQPWETLKEAITAYTGLSPTTFFTVLALVLAIYYLVSGLFGSSDNHPRPRSFEEMQPLPPPVQVGEISEEELKAYDGADPKKPLLMAIKGQIYDVSQSRMFYGPGGPYALFAGKDASRALAKMSFEDKDLTGDICGLGPFELEALQDWEFKFASKYVKVGTVKKTIPVTDGESTGEPTESTDHDAAKPAEDGPSENAAVKSDETPSSTVADE
ncbi:Membrane steroid-binding protein 2 [Quillaja saponaria]|uniref:Membrane steroid-binding protein 2 n=1 Tax=Quillaja saponaria TaxID=32244 RepID=A0AAD7Q6F9_QUISA|nr:Membrane steroid-binding protein 2 [Quillaja saponaria]